MKGAEARRVSIYCRRIDRLFNKLRSTNLLVRIDRKKRCAEQLITLVCYDLSNIQRVNISSDKSTGAANRPIFRARNIAGTMLWEFPYTYYSADKITGPMGVLWAAQISFQACDQPGIKFMTRISESSSLYPSLCLNIFEDDELGDRYIDYIQPAGGVSIPAEEQRYATRIRLVHVPEAASLPALLVRPGQTQEDIIRLVKNYTGILVTPVCCSAIDVSENKLLPN